MYKKLLTLLLVPALLLTLLVPVSASDVNAVVDGTWGSNLHWQLNQDTGVLEFSGSGEMSAATWPDTYPWLAYSDSIQQVVLGSGITTVADSAFGFTQLTEVTIPEGVTRIWSYAFEACHSLEKITLPASLSHLGNGVFQSSSLTDIYYAGSKALWQTVQIDGQNELLQDVTMHYHAGSDGSAYSGSCGDGLTWELSRETGVLTISGQGAMTDFQEAAPWDCCKNQILEVVLSDGVTTVGSRAFADCAKLQRVIAAGSMTQIGNLAFADCPALDEIVFFRNVPTVSASALTGSEWAVLQCPRNSDFSNLPSGTHLWTYSTYAALVGAAVSDNGTLLSASLVISQMTETPLQATCAVFDPSGKMLGLTSRTLENGVHSIAVSCSNGNVGQLKAFLTDSSYVPVCKAVHAPVF